MSSNKMMVITNQDPSSRRSSKSNHSATDTKIHVQHNSLVEFTFAEDLFSSNELTLMKLNSLFEKIADRNAMAIRADKLFQLILKTDRSEIVKERFRCILAVEVTKGGKIKGSQGVLRIVSRGPFLAMFKHESYSFVHSLENAARSMMNRKHKKKKKMKDKKTKSNKSSPSASPSASPSSSLSKSGANNTPTEESVESESNDSRKTIKSSPHTSHSFEVIKKKVLEKPNGLKRKQSDKTGMIITTHRDCCDEEMSAVSVSPVNVEDTSKGDQKQKQDSSNKKEKPTSHRHRDASDDATKSKESSLRTSKSKQSRKESIHRSSSKPKRKASNHPSSHMCLHIQNPIGNFNHEKSESTSSTSHHRSDMGHSRCDSALESITNIREVMQAHEYPKANKRLKVHHASSATMSTSLFVHPSYGIPSFPHPIMYSMSYGNMYPPAPWMQHNDQRYQETEENFGDEKDDTCFILDGLLSFVKGLFCKDNKVNHNKNRRKVGFVPNFVTNREGHVPYYPMQWQNMSRRNQSTNHYHEVFRSNNGRLGFTPTKCANCYYPDNIINMEQESMKETMQESTYNGSGSSPAETLSDVTGYLPKDNAMNYRDSSIDQNYDSSNMLQIYDFKPSFPLPEPETYYYKFRTSDYPKQKQKKPFVYDCSPNNNESGNINQNDISSFSTINVDQKLKTLQSVDNIQADNSVTSITDRLQFNTLITDSTLQEITAEFSNNYIVSKLKKDVSSGVLPHGPDTDLCASKSSDNGSIKSHSRQILDQRNPKIEFASEIDLAEDTSTKSMEKLVQIETKFLDEGSSSIVMMKDKKDNYKLFLDQIGHHPKDITRSRSLSDDKKSKLSHGADTQSLTRSSSFGSSVSSSLSSRATSMNQQQRRQQQNIRYHHYR